MHPQHLNVTPPPPEVTPTEVFLPFHTHITIPSIHACTTHRMVPLIEPLPSHTWPHHMDSLNPRSAMEAPNENPPPQPWIGSNCPTPSNYDEPCGSYDLSTHERVSHLVTQLHPQQEQDTSGMQPERKLPEGLQLTRILHPIARDLPSSSFGYIPRGIRNYPTSHATKQTPLNVHEPSNP